MKPIKAYKGFNALWLANGQEWEKTPIPQAKAIQKEEAWAWMPKEAFDAAIFEAVTGIKS